MARLARSFKDRDAMQLENLIGRIGSENNRHLMAPALLAVARLHLDADRPREAVEQAGRAIDAATPLRQRDVLLAAHKVAVEGFLALGETASAVRHSVAGLEWLDEMLNGLNAEDRTSFIQRQETVGFCAVARGGLESNGSREERERLEAACGAVPPRTSTRR